MIPKIIWQTHNYKYEDLPYPFNKVSRTWKNLNPSWDYRYVNHIEREQFVKENWPAIYDVYKEERPVVQSDIWRYMVVYIYGGVYADMDSVCIRPLDEMLELYNGEDIISPTSENKNQNPNNSHFAAIPGSPTLKKVIRDLEDDVKNINREALRGLSTWELFGKNIKRPEKNLFYYEAHSHVWKKYFYNYTVNTKNGQISYLDYLKNNMNLSDSEYKKSIPMDSEKWAQMSYWSKVMDIEYPQNEIPKIIWQTHNYEYEDLPDHLAKSARTWKYLNPDWEYRYVSSKDRELFVKNEVPELYDAYIKTLPMYQSDVWRYAAVYKYGGVYADMDSVCIKPLTYMLEKNEGESLIPLRKYPPHSYQAGLVNNSHFAAVKNCEALLDVLNFLKDNIEAQPDLIKLTWIAYAERAIKDSGLFFDAELHAHELKQMFFNFSVDWFGTKIKYSDYLLDGNFLDSDELLRSLPPQESFELKNEQLPPNYDIFVPGSGFIAVSNINT